MSMDTMNNCRDCKQPIKIDATKCHHCGTYQNWFRFLGTSVLLAGFVLTWVSIWAAPPIKQMLEAKRADIKVSILEGDFSHMTFMISNTGNQPAGLAQIEIESKLKHGSGSWYLYSELDKKLIEPGKAYVVKASNGSVVPAAVPHEVQAILAQRDLSAMEKKCNLIIQYVQMNGTKECLYYPFLCNQIASTEDAERK